MCRDKDHGARRCPGSKTAQGTKAISAILLHTFGREFDENSLRRAITKVYHRELANGASRDSVPAAMRDSYITQQEKENLMNPNLSKLSRATIAARWGKARLQDVSFAMLATWQRLTSSIKQGVGVAGLLIVLSACGANPYTPPEAPTAPASSSSASQTGEATQAPVVATTTAPGDASFRTGIWSQFDGTTVAIPQDANDVWGEVRTATAVDFALDSITDIYAGTDTASTPGARSVSDFAVTNEYLSTDAQAILAQSIEAGNAGDANASALVRSLVPAAIFNDDTTMTGASGELLLDTTRAEIDYRLTEVSVSKTQGTNGGEYLMTVNAGLDVIYSGTDANGAASTLTVHREQRISLVPAGDTSWVINGWGSTATVVK